MSCTRTMTRCAVALDYPPHGYYYTTSRHTLCVCVCVCVRVRSRAVRCAQGAPFDRGSVLFVHGTSIVMSRGAVSAYRGFVVRVA